MIAARPFHLISSWRCPLEMTAELKEALRAWLTRFDHLPTPRDLEEVATVPHSGVTADDVCLVLAARAALSR